MGCDIHIYKEKLVDGKWVTADVWNKEEDGDEVYYTNDNKDLRRRSYSAFAILAGVRGDPLSTYEMQSKGLPEQISEETEREYDRWKLDAHNVSYLTITELRNLQGVIETQTQEVAGYGSAGNIERLNEQIAAGDVPDWNLIYPHTAYAPNLSNGWVFFQYQVPIVIFIGDYVKNIIEALESIGGDDQRIVFWFDN